MTSVEGGNAHFKLKLKKNLIGRAHKWVLTLSLSGVLFRLLSARVGG